MAANPATSSAQPERTPARATRASPAARPCRRQPRAWISRPPERPGPGIRSNTARAVVSRAPATRAAASGVQPAPAASPARARTPRPAPTVAAGFTNPSERACCHVCGGCAPTVTGPQPLTRTKPGVKPRRRARRAVRSSPAVSAAKAAAAPSRPAKATAVEPNASRLELTGPNAKTRPSSSTPSGALGARATAEDPPDRVGDVYTGRSLSVPPRCPGLPPWSAPNLWGTRESPRREHHGSLPTSGNRRPPRLPGPRGSHPKSGKSDPGPRNSLH